MIPENLKSSPKAYASAADSLRDNIGDAVDRAKTDLSQSAEAARQAFGDDLSRLKADIMQLQKTVAAFASEAGGTTASTVKDVGQAVGAAASEAATAATDQAKTFASELEGMARRNPLGTLAGTLLVGVVLGMMTRNKS